MHFFTIENLFKFFWVVFDDFLFSDVGFHVENDSEVYILEGTVAKYDLVEWGFCLKKVFYILAYIYYVKNALNR